MTTGFATTARRARRVLQGLPIAAVLMVLACREATQVTLRITTDVACADLSGTTITPGDIGEIEETPFSTSTEACAASTPDNDIGTIVLFPLGDKDDSFGVKIVAGVDRPAEDCLPPLYEGCIVARRSMRYVPHTPLDLPIVLRQACKDVVCDPSSTCVLGTCVSAEVTDPGRCVGDACSEEALLGTGGTSATGGSGGSGGAAGSGASGGLASGGSGGGGAPVDAGAGAGGVDASLPPVDSGPTPLPEASVPDAAAPDATVPDATVLDAGNDAPSCALPLADCNGLASDGCETDTLIDSSHCGACNHGCLGTACTAGQCEPFPLVAAAAQPWAVAADETNVYYTDSGSNEVWQQAIAGGPPLLLASNQVEARGIAIDATHVYWSNYGNGGSISRAPIGGGTVEPIASPAMFSIFVAVDAINVYWAEGENPGLVYQTPKGGGTSVLIASDQIFPAGIATDGQSVFWANWANGGAIGRVDVGGGTVDVLAAPQGSPYSIAAFGGNVFYATDTGGEIASVPSAGGTVTLLADRERKPMGLAVDATGVYWANSGSGDVRKVVAGGSAVTIATNQTGVQSVALNSTLVVWQTSTSIVAVAK